MHAEHGVVFDGGQREPIENRLDTLQCLSLLVKQIAILKEGFDGPIKDGKLGDIAPTILALLGEAAPEVMTGEVLVDL